MDASEYTKLMDKVGGHSSSLVVVSEGEQQFARLNTEPLGPACRAAVMTTEIGRGAARLIKVISFNSFVCQVSFAMPV